MQVSQADVKNNRVGVEEHLINFKSSPNLKNMKKFIRSKMDHIEVKKWASLNVGPDPPPPPNIYKMEKKSVLQPPLPLDPPPPDEHVPFKMHVKTEIEDLEYLEGAAEDDKSQEETTENDAAKIYPEKKVPVCRDFIRGTCKRPGTCKFAHKYDISQLVGVYTFCRNFQTSVCTHPNCKYVHASVFAEHHFYRTGYLPPNALAHHKKNMMLPPPPPPLKEPQQAFTNPPPPLQPGMMKANNQPQPINIPGTSVKPNDSAQQQSPGSPMKRDWGPQQFNNVDNSEQVTKKCRNCDDSKTRLEYHKLKVDRMRHVKEELGKKINQLDKKSEILNTIILAALKPSFSKALNHANGVNTLNGDKEKWLLEQLDAMFNVNARHNTLSEDK